MKAIPILAIIVFFASLLLINRKNLGVKTFTEYATANSTFGFLSITFAVLATWYVGATFTAWASMGMVDGFAAMYVTPYATFTTVVMYLIGERVWTWAKIHKYATQSDFLGHRYQSKLLQVVTGTLSTLFVAPWLLLEWVTEGYVFSYASGGAISPEVGMAVGILVVLVYVSLGGMKSVITANFLQGTLMIFGGTALFVWIINYFFGGVGAGYQMLISDYQEILTWSTSIPTAAWTSMIFASAVGAFMWPWAFNKLYAAGSIAEIKKSALLAPALGTIFYLFFVFLSNFMHSMPGALADTNAGFMWLASEMGVWPLAFLSVLIMAVSVGTVSGIVQGMSSSVARDIAPALKKNISDQAAIKIARGAVLGICIICFLFALGDLPKLISIVLLTYQGIIQLFPPIILGLFWRRANVTGALWGFIVGTVVAMALNWFNPAFIGQYGWSGGMIALPINFIIMIVCGMMKPATDHANRMFDEFNIIKAKSRKKALALRKAA